MPDRAFDGVLAERGAVTEAVGPQLFAFDVDPVPGGSTDRIVVYEGADGVPVKLDLMYLKESDLVPAPKWSGCAVLEDDGGRVGDVIDGRRACASPSLAGGPPGAQPEVLGLVLVRLRQDRPRRAVGSVGWPPQHPEHRARSPAGLGSRRRHEGYRRLEGKLDPETASRLKDTLSPLEPDALHAALRAEVGLFRDLRAEVFGRHGLAFDPAPEEALEAEMDRRWAGREGVR